MIDFRPMDAAEYPDYLAYFIADYAQEIASNYRLSLDDARARAQQEIEDSLPLGVNSPGQVLLCIMLNSGQTEQHVGYLWYKPDPTMRSVFIYDFHIFNHCQGQGLGKKALAAFEQQLRKQQFQQIRLRVAGDNCRAQHVYEKCGFGVTGINMSKTISE